MFSPMICGIVTAYSDINAVASRLGAKLDKEVERRSMQLTSPTQLSRMIDKHPL